MPRLSNLTPHQQLRHNPLFRLEARRTRWGENADLLVRRSLRNPLILCGGLLLIWLFVAAQDGSRHGEIVVMIAFFVSLPALLWIDFNSLSAAVGSINGEIVAGRWDLLRLTPLTVRDIIAAKHGSAQVRAWQSMALVTGLRLGVFLIAIATFFWEITSSGFFDVPANILAELLVFSVASLLLGGLYLIEPWWRMRAFTALGVSISARARHQTTSLLAAAGAVIGLWIAEGFILLALLLISSLFLAPLGAMEGSAFHVAICSPLLFVVVVAAAAYGFYSIIQRWSLRRAERWLVLARHTR